MDDHTPLYNSRITKNYLEYLDKFYQGVDIEKILKASGITHQEVDDPGLWFTQHQVDRFQEALIRETGNHSFSREVGRYLASSEGLGPVRQYMLGLLSPMAIYMLMGKLYTMLSRAATVKTKKIGNSAVEIISTPKSGVNEKKYQCENRLGSFESLARLFTKGYARIEHPSCIHKGDSACRYIISWERVSSIMWKRARYGLLIFSIFTLVWLYHTLPLEKWIDALFTGIFLNTVSILFSQHVEKKEFIKTIEAQGNAAEELFEEMNIRYNNAVLIQEIGQATSAILNINELLNQVMTIIQKRLDFDRGMIMLADEQKKHAPLHCRLWV